MKTKIFAVLLGMLCLYSLATGQNVEPPLSGFNGKVQFQGFVNNGLFIRGTLGEFLDQTNQYFASDIDTNDVAWDNLGRKYRVVAVISSNLTQAVVDMARVGGGTHFPSGVGMVNREVSGLSLIPTSNSTGISSQLLSRILTNNMSVLGNNFLSYVGTGDSLYGAGKNAGFIRDGIYWGIYKPWNNGSEYMQLTTYYDGNYKLYTSFEGYANNGNNGGWVLFAAEDKPGTLNAFADLTAYNRQTRGRNNTVRVDSSGVSFRGYRNNLYGLWSYKFPKPDLYPVGQKLSLEWTGINGVNGIPGAFIRGQRSSISAITDSSGDITVSIPDMPDVNFSALIQITGTTLYSTTVHTKTTTSFKVRCFNSSGTVLGAGITVPFDFEVKDY